MELIRREIVKQHPQAQVNTVLVDFFLYDLAKEREAQGECGSLELYRAVQWFCEETRLTKQVSRRFPTTAHAAAATKD